MNDEPIDELNFIGHVTAKGERHYNRTVKSCSVLCLLVFTAVSAHADPNLVSRTEKYHIELRTFTADSGDVKDKCIPPDQIGMARKLLYFDTVISNVGSEDFIVGRPPADGQSVAPFVWSAGHGHHHIADFNNYDVLNAGSQFVQAGLKQSFCITDWEKWDPNAPPEKFSTCKGIQGIQPGWADRYPGTPDVNEEPLPCQFVDITGLPDGDYRLVVRSNGTDESSRFPESNIHDNAYSAAIRIAGDTVTKIANQWVSESIAGRGIVNTAVTAVASEPNRLDVFGRGSNNDLIHKWWDGKGWSQWESLGGVITTEPHAISWGPGRLDIFARGLDNVLLHIRWDGTSWGRWERLGGNLASPPYAISWAPNRLDVFAVGQQGELLHTAWTGTRWAGVTSLGGSLIQEQPAAVSWGRNRIDVFARGAGHDLQHRWFNGSWHPWESLGGLLSSPPAVASSNLRLLNVVARGEDNAIWHTGWDGSSWGWWEQLGGASMGTPRIISWAPDRLDVFAISGPLLGGDKRTLMQISWNGSSWRTRAVGSPPATGLMFVPAVASWAVNHFSVFWSGNWGVTHGYFF